jgi:hypothetical protein
VFRRVRQVRFVRSPGAAPFLAIPVVQLELARLPTVPPTRFELGAGSIWICASTESASWAVGLASWRPRSRFKQAIKDARAALKAK